jgi:hypothetical protein
VVEDAKREWNFDQACEIMRINKDWFIDERTVEMIRLYLFYRPNPSQAFQGRITEQPSIWVETKLILDGVFGTGLF